MNRRDFVSRLVLSPLGLLVPEWLLDPPRGRSMISVPDMNSARPKCLLSICCSENGTIISASFADSMQEATDFIVRSGIKGKILRVYDTGAL